MVLFWIIYFKNWAPPPSPIAQSKKKKNRWPRPGFFPRRHTRDSHSSSYFSERWAYELKAKPHNFLSGGFQRQRKMKDPRASITLESWACSHTHTKLSSALHDGTSPSQLTRMNTWCSKDTDAIWYGQKCSDLWGHSVLVLQLCSGLSMVRLSSWSLRLYLAILVHSRTGHWNRLNNLVQRQEYYTKWKAAAFPLGSLSIPLLHKGTLW